MARDLRVRAIQGSTRAVRLRSASMSGTVGAAGSTIHWPINEPWLATLSEEIIEPDLPIIDAHHHLMDRPLYRYLLPEFLADVNTGHNVKATVFVQASAMYRADGPIAYRTVGETEFVNGCAAMSASGLYGPTRACAGIVSHVDLLVGEGAKTGARGPYRRRQRSLPRHQAFGGPRREPGGSDDFGNPARGAARGSSVPKGLRRPGAAGSVVRRLGLSSADRRGLRSGAGFSRDR